MVTNEQGRIRTCNALRRVGVLMPGYSNSPTRSFTTLQSDAMPLKSIVIIVIFLILSSLFWAGMAGADGDFPSLNIARSGNAYDVSTSPLVDSVYFWARNADIITAGYSLTVGSGEAWYDSLKEIAKSVYGRTIKVYIYDDIHFIDHCYANENAEWDSSQSVVDSFGYSWNKQFMWEADDSVNYTFPVSSGRCAGATEGNRKYSPSGLLAAGDTNEIYVVHDVIINNSSDPNYPSGGVYMQNYPSAEFRTWKPYFWKKEIDAHKQIFDLDSVPDGFFLDNCAYGSATASSYICNTNRGNYWSTYGGNTGSGWTTNSCSNTDWYGYNDVYGSSAGNLYTQFQATGRTVCSTAYNNWNIGFVANAVDLPGNYLNDFAHTASGAVMTLFFELRGIDCIYGGKAWSTLSTNGTSGEIARIDSAAKHQIPYINEFRLYSTSQGSDTGNSFWAHSAITFHWAVESPAYAYFCYQNKGTGGASFQETGCLNNWALFKRYIGDTLTARNYVDTGTTVYGDGVHIYWREYDSCFVFYFVKDQTSDDTTAANYQEWNCGKPVYVLGETYPGQCDSSYKSDGVIQIRPAHGVVAWKASSEASPGIGSILPASSYRDSTDAVTATITDDYGVNHIYNYVWPPDSVHGSNDSISIFDSAYSTGDTAVTWNPSHDYTWLDSGDYQIVFVAIDDSSNTTRDSQQILISVQAAAEVSVNINHGYYGKGIKQ